MHMFSYGVQVSRESPEEAKERAKEACQKRLASAVEAGELEPLREAIDAADLAGCSTSLLKQARSRRDALRKAARRLERQAAGAQCEEEARRQREQRAAEAAAEEEKARVEAAEERAAARQAAAKAEEERAAAAKAAEAERARRHRLLEEQEVAERKAKQEAAQEAARLAAAERARGCSSQSATVGGDAVGTVAPAGSPDASAAAASAAAVASVALDRPQSSPAPSSNFGTRGRGRGRGGRHGLNSQSGRGGQQVQSAVTIATENVMVGAVAHELDQVSLQLPADGGAYELADGQLEAALQKRLDESLRVKQAKDDAAAAAAPEDAEARRAAEERCNAIYKKHIRAQKLRHNKPLSESERAELERLRSGVAAETGAGSSSQHVEAAPVSPPAPPAAVMSLADAQFVTGRPEVPESTIGGQTSCIICFAKPKSHAAVPCGHQCACADCSAQMKECPVCRRTTLMWMQVQVV